MLLFQSQINFSLLKATTGQRITMFVKAGRQSLVENLMRECELDVKESLKRRIVVHAIQFQIPFLEHLESKGMISLGAEDIGLHDGEMQAAVPGASAHDKLSFDPRDEHQDYALKHIQ